MNEECSAILNTREKITRKLKNPWSFTIPCTLEELSVSGALDNLGASVNLIPYDLFKKFGVGKPKPTRMRFQLVDRFVKYHRGIIEDVLVQVESFIFPIDFTVSDMSEDVEVPLILG